MKLQNKYFSLQVENLTLSIPANVVFSGELARKRRNTSDVEFEVFAKGYQALDRRGKSPFTACVNAGLAALAKRGL